MGTLIFNPYLNVGIVTDGLVAQYDPSDSSTITESSSIISEVADKSGNGNTLTVGLGEQTYNSSGLNGLGTIVSNTGYLEKTNSSILNNVSGATFFVLRKYPGAVGSFNSNSSLIFVSTATPTQVRAGLTPNPSASTADRLALGGRRLDGDSYNTISSSVDSVATSGSWDLEIGEFNYDSGLVNHWLNGTKITDNSSFQTAGNTSSTNSVIKLLGNSTSNDVPINTEIALALVYNRVLSSQERLATQSFISRKWGLGI